MVTASDGFKSITRNSSKFKITPKKLKAEGDRREQEELEHFLAEQAEDSDPQVQTTAACGGHRDKGDPPARLSDYVQIIY